MCKVSGLLDWCEFFEDQVHLFFNVSQSNLCIVDMCSIGYVSKISHATNIQKLHVQVSSKDS